MKIPRLAYASVGLFALSTLPILKSRSQSASPDTPALPQTVATFPIPSQSEGKIVVVKHGDKLFLLMKRIYGVSSNDYLPLVVDEKTQKPLIDPNKITVGQKLRFLPKPEGIPTPVSTPDPDPMPQSDGNPNPPTINLMPTKPTPNIPPLTHHGMKRFVGTDGIPFWAVVLPNQGKPDKPDAKDDKTVIMPDATSMAEDKRFLKVMQLVFKYEGGYSNREGDRGGATFKGITMHAYNDYCKRHALTPLASSADLKLLTAEQQQQFYFDDYWCVSHANQQISFAMAARVMNAAVTSGASFAKKLALLAQGDGERFNELLKAHYIRVSTPLETDRPESKAQKIANQQFVQGWLNRMARLESDLKEYNG